MFDKFIEMYVSEMLTEVIEEYCRTHSLFEAIIVKDFVDFVAKKMEEEMNGGNN